MDSYKLLLPFLIFIGMMFALHNDSTPKKHSRESETFSTKSGQREKDVSSSAPVELLNVTKRKRVLREADPDTEKECPERRGSSSLFEKMKCPETCCQHVSYSCSMQCPGQDKGAPDCELYNCTGAHRCSSTREHNIPIEEVCDNIDQCPDSDDESNCVRPCWPSCMCIGLTVNYRSTLRFHLKEITNITNNNDQQTAGFLHLSYLSYLVITDIQTLSESFIRGFNNLKSLDVSNNKLSFLSDDVFRELPSLLSLDLSSNVINHLSSSTFNGLSYLVVLDLSNNQFEELPGNIFRGLLSLTALYLNGNHIIHLPEDVFHGLSALSHLNLGRNQFVALPANVFNGLSALKSLYLYYNQFEGFPDNLFSGLSALESLYLYDNTIIVLPENVFQGLSALSELKLGQNQITKLPDNVFNGLSALESLHLSYNQIAHLPKNVFQGLSALLNLDLAQNQIKKLPDNVFNGLSVLENLFLSNNKIIVLPENVFNGLSALSNLDLARNQIKKLPDNVFKGLYVLTSLDLSDNQITHLPKNVFQGLSALLKLDLARNQIKKLPDNVFNGLYVLTSLFLSNNKITHLPKNVFQGLSALLKLDLARNQIKKLPDNVFKGLSVLTSLFLSNNKITHLPKNVFQGLSALLRLDLAQNEIKKLPDDVFNGLSVLRNLSLSHNQITVLPEKVFQGPSALVILDLDGNQLDVLSDHVFNGLSGLGMLTLGKNPIISLPKNIFDGLSALVFLNLEQNQISVLPDVVFMTLPALKFIMLNGNKLSVLPALPFSVELLDISYNSFTKLHHGSFINNSKMSLLNIVGNDLEVSKYIFEGLDDLNTLLTDTPFMCCVKPRSVSEDRCLKLPASDLHTTFKCFEGRVSCKSKGDAISSCDALIGSGIMKVCLWVIGVCALVGNVSVFIYRLFIDRDNITMSYSLFVLNLSISDFLMGVYILMIGVADVYYDGVYAWNDKQWRTSIVCTIAGSLSTISSEMSTFLILLVTIDRVIVIAFPVSRLSRWNISWKQATIISVSLWFVSVALAVIPVIGPQSYFKGEYYSQSGVCLALPLTSDRQPGSEYSFAIFVCLNSIIFVVIVIGQICIVKSLVTSDGCITSSQTRQRDMAVARTLFMVVASDFCCWFPIGVMGVMAKTGYKIPNDAYAWVMVFVLPVNAAINPFLYTATAIWRRRQRAKGKEELRKSANRNWKNQAKAAKMESAV